MLQRNSDAWHEALDEHVLTRAAMPFSWGSNDCCTFAADWVQTARGTDPMADLRGLTSAKTAARTLQAEGGLLAAVAARMGDALPGAMAHVGDVVLVRHGKRTSMGICMGHLAAVPGIESLQRVSITTAEAAWRV